MPQLSTGISSFVSALPRVIVGGLAGTIVFTLMMKFLAPAMIGHPMDIAAVLGRFTGLGTLTGAVMHFVLGTLGFAIGLVIVGSLPAGSGLAARCHLHGRSLVPGGSDRHAGLVRSRKPAGTICTTCCGLTVTTSGSESSGFGISRSRASGSGSRKRFATRWWRNS